MVQETMTALLTPILSFTAEEIWKFMPHRAGENTESVMLEYYPKENPLYENYDYLYDVLDAALKHENVSNAIFSVVFMNDEEIHEMNMNFRQIDRPTDVLSFPTLNLKPMQRVKLKDFKEDIGYLSDKFNYDKILGRARKWSKDLCKK